MRQNFIGDHIPVLGVPFLQNSMVALTYFNGAINSQHGHFPGASYPGNCVVFDLDSDALFSYECSWKWDNGVPSDFYAFVFTSVVDGVGAKSIDLSLTNNQPCVLHAIDSERRSARGRVVVPKLEVSGSQVQVVGIALLNSGAADATFSLRVHAEDVQVFDPLR